VAEKVPGEHSRPAEADSNADGGHGAQRPPQAVTVSHDKFLFCIW
jgi:hypothetical protein